MNKALAVLVIEDSPSDFRLIDREIRHGGLQAQCFRVETLEDLIGALETGGWDIILSDYSVPGLNFESNLSLIRGRCPDIPVILVSGSVGEKKAIDLFKLPNSYPNATGAASSRFFHPRRRR